MVTTLDAARWYGRRGWPVLPLRGKIAVLPDWPNAASTDPERITRWFDGQPDRGVGIVTGRRSGLLVVDVDPRNGGTESLSRLETEIGVLPGTVQQLTGGGGVHLLFACPEVPVRSRANALGPGLDVKCDGGYIVVAPSRHPDTGQAYRWLGDTPAGQLAELPAGLLDRLTRPATPLISVPGGLGQPGASGASRARPDRVLAGLVQTVMDAPQGERNARLFWAASRVAEHAAAGLLDRAVALEALRLAGEAVGLDGPEVRATVNSALRARRGAA